ncbi:autotransporter domain-containing protein [Bartonella sp. B12(2025)]
MDGVFKCNHYRDNLKVISTNALAIQSDYKQWVIGGSCEISCCFELAQSAWMQPYIKLTGVRLKVKNELSNGVTGDISPLISFRSTVGLTAGYEFMWV